MKLISADHSGTIRSLLENINFDQVSKVLGRLVFTGVIAAGVHSLAILNFYLAGYTLRLGTFLIFTTFSAICSIGILLATLDFGKRFPKTTLLLMLPPAVWGTPALHYYNFLLGPLMVISFSLLVLRLFGRFEDEMVATRT